MTAMSSSISAKDHPLSVPELKRYVPSIFAEEAHESRSDRYRFIPTSAVLDGLIQQGFEPFSASQQRVRDQSKRDFTRHVIRLRHGEAAKQVGDVVPEIVLLNSHDGTSAYRLMAGLFRVVCSNGMIVAESTCADVKIRHSGDVVDEVVEGAFTVVDSIGNALKSRETFSKVTLTMAEQEAFGAASAELRWGKNETLPVDPYMLTARSRFAEDQGTDLWRTFNRVQYNLMHGGLHGRSSTGRRLTTRAITGVSEDIRLNRALWTLTEKMAELKA